MRRNRMLNKRPYVNLLRKIMGLVEHTLNRNSP